MRYKVCLLKTIISIAENSLNKKNSPTIKIQFFSKVGRTSPLALISESLHDLTVALRAWINF